MSESFLEVCEQMGGNPDALPGGLRAYQIDGHVVWATKAFADHLQRLADLTQGFVESCPHMESRADNQECVQRFCLETGLCKPCYDEDCWGCDEGPDGKEESYCGSPDEDWQQNEAAKRGGE